MLPASRLSSEKLPPASRGTCQWTRIRCRTALGRCQVHVVDQVARQRPRVLIAMVDEAVALGAGSPMSRSVSPCQTCRSSPGEKPTKRSPPRSGDSAQVPASAPRRRQLPASPMTFCDSHGSSPPEDEAQQGHGAGSEPAGLIAEQLHRQQAADERGGAGEHGHGGTTRDASEGGREVLCHEWAVLNRY